MRNRPVRLRLEALEDRWCPSLTVQNVSGYLIISGTPVGTNAAGGLLIQGTAAHTNNFTIKDGSSFLGTYQVTGNLYLNLNNHQGEGINIDLNSNTIPGNLFINLGTGNNTGSVQNSVAVYNSTGGATTGRIGGNLQVVNGSGSETFIPGFQNNFSNIPTAFGLRVGGDLTFNAKMGGPTPSNFDVLDTGAGSAVAGTPTPTVIVGGNVNTTAVDAVGLGPTTTVGKSVSIAAAGERPLFVNDFATVQGNVGITGSQLRAPNPVLGTAQLGDFIEVGGFPTGTAFVGGSLQMSAGAGDAFFLIDPGTPGERHHLDHEQLRERHRVGRGRVFQQQPDAEHGRRQRQHQPGPRHLRPGQREPERGQRQQLRHRRRDGGQQPDVQLRQRQQHRDRRSGTGRRAQLDQRQRQRLGDAGRRHHRGRLDLERQHAVRDRQRHADALRRGHGPAVHHRVRGHGRPPGGNVFNQGANWTIVQPFTLQNV
jgi:hypothetical protein